MLSYKLDFNSCACKLGFVKSSHIYVIIHCAHMARGILFTDYIHIALLECCSLKVLDD